MQAEKQVQTMNDSLLWFVRGVLGGMVLSAVLIAYILHLTRKPRQ